MRNISTTLSDKFLSKDVDLFVAVELMFDSGALRIWSGIGDKSIGGQTYTGTGSLLSLVLFKSALINVSFISCSVIIHLSNLIILFLAR